MTESDPASAARPFGIGPLRVEISGADPHLVERLDRLFASLPDPPDDPAETVTISVQVTDDGYETHIDGRRRVRASDLSQHDAGIASRLNRLALDHEPHLLHLHAGVVARGDDGVVLLGPSGSGKSTLTAHLVRSGWTYLTDEMVAVEPDPLRLRPFPRPLTLKSGSWHLFPEVPDIVAAAGREPAPPRVEVPSGALGAAVATAPVAPALLVSVRVTDGEPSVEPLSSTAVLSDLVGDSLDLGRVGIEGMHTLVALAASVPAVRLHSADLDRSEALLIESLDTTSVRPARFRYLAPDPRRSAAHAWELSDAGGGVVYDADTGVLVAIDASGLALWEALAETSSPVELAARVGAPDDAVASIEEFIASLSDHGIPTQRLWSDTSA